jgi:outer membrane murein-binding lipoprotein Lpp
MASSSDETPPTDSILAMLQKLEADVEELRKDVQTLAPTVQAVAATLRKVGPEVAEMLRTIKAFGLV